MGLLPGSSGKQIARFLPAPVLTSEQRITHPKDSPCPLPSWFWCFSQFWRSPPPLSPSFCSGSTRGYARIWTSSRKRILSNMPPSSARLLISSASSPPQPIPPRQLLVNLHRDRPPPPLLPSKNLQFQPPTPPSRSHSNSPPPLRRAFLGRSGRRRGSPGPRRAPRRKFLLPRPRASLPHRPSQPIARLHRGRLFSSA